MVKKSLAATVILQAHSGKREPRNGSQRYREQHELLCNYKRLTENARMPDHCGLKA